MSGQVGPSWARFHPPASQTIVDARPCGGVRIILTAPNLAWEAVVKVAGRALDIVAVGLGQAGGNLAAELSRRGYRAIAFNTAASDLSTLSSRGLSLPEEQRVYIGIDGHDGAGSDASYGRECVRAHASEIRDRVLALAE
jgi:hypothetical protein